MLCASLSLSDLSFASDQYVLGMNIIGLTNNFKLYPNPISLILASIDYVLPSKVNQLAMTVYDVIGKQGQHQDNVANTPE